MKRSSDLKADIDKIKKLKALQQKATDKLDKIADASAPKPTKKKAAVPKPAAKQKAATKKPGVHKKTRPATRKKKSLPGRKARKTPEKKSYFWRTIFGKKGKSKRSKAKEAGQRS